MKRQAFIRELEQAGCVLHRNGARHDIYRNPANGKKAPVPRHRATMRRRQKGSATLTWWRPTTCSGLIRAPITVAAASVPPRTPITIHSCCSVFCPAAPNRSALPWVS